MVKTDDLSAVCLDVARDEALRRKALERGMKDGKE